MAAEKIKYELFEHTADLGLIIYGGSLEELLENAGFALFDQMIDLSKVSVVEKLDISAEGSSKEEILLAWLRELLYRFHTERYLFKEFKILELTKNHVRGVAGGERIERAGHDVDLEVKGATYHNLEVKHFEGGWKARVLFDI